MTFKPAAVIAVLVLCGLSLTASTTSQAPAQAPGTGVVAGQVIDETTKRPVGGAVVTLSAMALRIGGRRARSARAGGAG